MSGASASIGAGTMGHGIAQVFAQAGFDVLLHDTSAAALDRARQGIEKSLAKFVEKGKLAAADRDATLGAPDAGRRARRADRGRSRGRGDRRSDRGQARAVRRARSPDAAGDAARVEHVVDLDHACSAPRPSRADRVFGLHFMNPVPLMPLVELVRGQATSDATMAAGVALTRALGKTGIESADYPGFIANRILMPMINEAVFALMEGVGTAEAIDGVMKLGMNHPMGPLTLADFIGLDVCVAILDVLHDGLGDPKYRACPLLRRLVAAGHLGRKSGRGFYSYA